VAPSTLVFQTQLQLTIIKKYSGFSHKPFGLCIKPQFPKLLNISSCLGQAIKSEEIQDET
jgi:hypothetical protein